MDVQLHNLEFTCPHCGHKNVYRCHQMNSYKSTELVYCSLDTGGCDTQIVLKVEMEIKHTAVGLKIEGIEPDKDEEEENNKL